MARHFNPRSPLPKKRLLEELEKGLTLQEIGDKYGRSRSFISENCAMYNIDVSKMKDREEKLKERKYKKRTQNFINVMYDKIAKEL